MYKLEKTLLGKVAVVYSCGSCGIELRSPLEEAGQQEKCPSCKHSFIVPGAKDKIAREQERSRLEQERIATVERKAAAKLAEDQRRELLRKITLSDPKVRATESGWADRFLALAFGFGKYASVAIVALCFVVIVGSIVWLALVRAEIPTVDVPTANAPTASEYQSYLTSQATSSSTPDAAGAPLFDAGDSSYIRLDKIVKKYVGVEDYNRRLILSIHERLGNRYRSASDDLVSGVEQFIQRISAANKTITGDSLYWFISRYANRLETTEEAKAYKLERSRKAEDAAAAKRLSLLYVVIGSLLSLLSFLVLPLLIMIEKNTRRTKPSNQPPLQ